MPPIIFIHGLAGSHNNFMYLRRYFKDSLAFDLPGFGREKKPKVVYTKNFFLKFIEEKITERYGKNAQCILVGHSLGAILAKDYALAHPTQVKKIFLIGYPLQKTRAALRHKLETHLTNRMFVKKDIFSQIMCRTKIFWKYAVLPFLWLFNRKYYCSYRDYFLHTYHSETSTIHETILKDDPYEVFKLKEKAILIVGEHDTFVNFEMTKNIKTHIISKMGHEFFGFEEKIARVINQTKF